MQAWIQWHDGHTWVMHNVYLVETSRSSQTALVVSLVGGVCSVVLWWEWGLTQSDLWWNIKCCSLCLNLYLWLSSDERALETSQFKNNCDDSLPLKLKPVSGYTLVYPEHVSDLLCEHWQEFMVPEPNFEPAGTFRISRKARKKFKKRATCTNFPLWLKVKQF